MKFELKYPNASLTECHDFEYSHVTKDAKLGQCDVCGSFTRWIDVRMQKHVCSEECGGKLWAKVEAESKQEKFNEYKSKIEDELKAAAIVEDKWKDIIIVVRDQLTYFKSCIESIREHTHNFNLYIWDNASGSDMQKYYDQLRAEYHDLSREAEVAGEELDWTFEVWNVDCNMGFIEPNNKMAEIGNGDYIIPLNSDTKVFKYWDTAMIAFMVNNPEVAQVGYWGGHMDAEGRGFGGDNGYEIDYIPGWCFCISRQTYDKFGLFDKQLKFAYCEDGDLSLRLKEAGHKIYALYAPLVYHYQNKTIEVVEKEGEVDVRASFEHNHKYIQHRWKEYLETKRVLLIRGKDSDEQVQSTAG